MYGQHLHLMDIHPTPIDLSVRLAIKTPDLSECKQSLYNAVAIPVYDFVRNSLPSCRRIGRVRIHLECFDSWSGLGLVLVLVLGRG